MSSKQRPKRLCLVGATGLIGSTLVEQSVSRSDIRLVGVARREAKLPQGARMEMLVAEPLGWADAIAAANADVLVCALGTTRRKAGNDGDAFRAVDHDLVLACGRAAKDAGIDHVIVVSSVGARPGSEKIYLQTKGRVEQELGRMRFRRLDIVRPGLLRGRRAEKDRRPAERLAQLVSPVADMLLHGKFRKYRSIAAATVARAILALATEKAGGQFIHEHDAMLYAIRRSSG